MFRLVVVFATSFTSLANELEDEYCHLTMLPVWPLKVRAAEVPEQIVVPPFTVPPTEVAFTVNVATLEVRLAPPQPTIITRYW